MDTNILPAYIKNSGVDQESLLGVLMGNSINENIDSSGNQIVDMNSNTLENNFIALKQSYTEYSSNKIDQSYQTNFSELLDESSETQPIDVIDDITDLADDQLKRENVLNGQLDELSKLLELESQKNIKIQENAEKDFMAMKGVIIDMRIKNGEGLSEDDFEPTFPFVPKNKKEYEKQAFDS